MDLSHCIENGRTFIRMASLEKLEMTSPVIGLLPLGLYDQLCFCASPGPFLALSLPRFLPRHTRWKTRRTTSYDNGVLSYPSALPSPQDECFFSSSFIPCFIHLVFEQCAALAPAATTMPTPTATLTTVVTPCHLAATSTSHVRECNHAPPFTHQGTHPPFSSPQVTTLTPIRYSRCRATATPLDPTVAPTSLPRHHIATGHRHIATTVQRHTATVHARHRQVAATPHRRRDPTLPRCMHAAATPRCYTATSPPRRHGACTPPSCTHVTAATHASTPP